ncbi:ribonuclease P [Candidatus Woesearchaeota archaeon]|nr:ribonuclease P [Candidatus Woesearchaeota archaeon]MCF7900855.1 ribonuclease P [Candidatus Woesearchaeota archaeon]MCF8014029.1 ribonuclease P [Candidatus Woesearchaeota archaeon]
MKLRKIKNSKNNNKKIAKERIEELFNLAEKTYSKEPKMACEYAKSARKFSLKYKQPFTKSQKTRFCKQCESYLFPGLNSRLRVNKGKIIVLCNNCKHISRYIYKKS